MAPLQQAHSDPFVAVSLQQVVRVLGELMDTRKKYVHVWQDEVSVLPYDAGGKKKKDFHQQTRNTGTNTNTHKTHKT